MSPPFSPTHSTPAAGLDSWPRPDPNAPIGPHISPGLPLQLLARSGDWAKVTFDNGWTAWVDGRLLVAVGSRSPGLASSTGSGGGSFDFATLMTDRPKAFAIGGAALVAVSALLPWARGASSTNSFDLPAAFLVDYKTTSTGGIKVGWLLVAIAVAIVFVIVRGAHNRVERGLGIAAMAVPALYLVQLQRYVSAARGVSITDLVGIGVVGTIAGGVLVLAAPRLANRTR